MPRSPTAPAPPEPHEALWHPPLQHTVAHSPPELSQQLSWACVRRPYVGGLGPGRRAWSAATAPALRRPWVRCPAPLPERSQGHHDRRGLNPTALLGLGVPWWAPPVPCRFRPPDPHFTGPTASRLPRRSAPGRNAVRGPMTPVVIFTSSGACVQLPACRQPGTSLGPLELVCLQQKPHPPCCPSSAQVPPCPHPESSSSATLSLSPASAHKGPVG